MLFKITDTFEIDKLVFWFTTAYKLNTVEVSSVINGKVFSFIPVSIHSKESMRIARRKRGGEGEIKERESDIQESFTEDADKRTSIAKEEK